MTVKTTLTKMAIQFGFGFDDIKRASLTTIWVNLPFGHQFGFVLL